MVVPHFKLRPTLELADPHPLCDGPDTACDILRVAQAVLLHRQIQILVADHINEHSADITVRRRIVAVPLRKVLRAVKELVVFAVDQFFTIEEDEVDSVPRPNVPDVMSEFHQQGDAAGAVVRPDEDSSRVTPIAVGVRPRVVMAAQQHAVFRSGIERHHQVGHANRCSVHGMRHVKRLRADLATKLSKVLDELSLLPLHSGRTADAPADLADLLQVNERAFRVERNGQVLSRHR